MKIKITHPVSTPERSYQAGETVTVTDKQAREWIDSDWAFEIVEEKKVKHADRQNDTQ